MVVTKVIQTQFKTRFKEERAYMEVRWPLLCLDKVPIRHGFDSIMGQITGSKKCINEL